MEKQFEYLLEKAQLYWELNNSDEALFEELNDLEREVLEKIYEEYSQLGRTFKPVNLARAKATSLLLKGEILSSDVVEEIFEKIRSKQTDFFSEFSEEQVNGLKEYEISKKRDVFANWQNKWSLFHSFFFRDVTKETINLYLDQIGKKLLEDLKLSDYQIHTVDFSGPNNFGDDRAWIALYPIQKNSHRDAYQFFVDFHLEAKAGRIAGDYIKDAEKNQTQKIVSYTEALDVLKNLRSSIIELNKSTRNYFKFSPGAQAVDWDMFKKQGIAGVDYHKLEMGDISDVNTLEELNVRAGLEPDNQSNKTWNTWLLKTANKGDVLFVSKGRDTILGIGIIRGKYFYDSESSVYAHRRKVEWITDKVYEYKAYTIDKYKHLFRADSFSPTKKWEFILNEYVRMYPELADEFDEHNLPYSSVIDRTENEIAELDEEDEKTNYWWLNANPKIWRIENQEEGERQVYTARNERGNKRRIYKYFEAVKPGDQIIGYESSPVKQVRAIMQITKGLHKSEKLGEVIEFEILEKLEVPVSWNELKKDPSLKECEVFVNNQGSLFSLKEEEFEIIQSTIDDKNINQEKRLEIGEKEKYEYQKDPDKPFLSFSDFKGIIALLKRKKNIILQGPPGVGKTFIARKLAYEFMGFKNDAQIEMIQFHQSYSYEDFIQGIRLNEDGTEIRDGIFYSFCQKAHAHPDRLYFMIIDEINRGNLSKIFGELLMLIEEDKRDETYAAKLTYSEGEEDRFYVPPNVHLIGTMNTADRSLAILDYALRRRFAFITLDPITDKIFSEYLIERGLSKSLTDHICKSLEVVNGSIKTDPNLGDGFQIGHSYFCTYKNSMEEESWYKDVLKYEIKPLLEEIWFDNQDRVGESLSILEM